MNRILGRTVLITGASAGIGEACARAVAERGARLVLLARRTDRLAELAGELRSEHGTEVWTSALDVRDLGSVTRIREEVESEGFLPDVIINNAGKARGLDFIHEGDVSDWDEMIDTNIKGLLYVTRTFLPEMIARDEGHVVNIGSISGQWLYPKGGVYCGTKFAVRAITEGLSMDLFGTNVRVSSIDPGMVETEFSEVRFHGDVERAETAYRGFRALQSEDVADVVCYVLNAPPHVDIYNVVMMSTDQRHATLVHRSGA